MADVTTVSDKLDSQISISTEAECTVKNEGENSVKQEPLECCVCGRSTAECSPAGGVRTRAGTALPSFVRRYTGTPVALTAVACVTCSVLVDLLEQAELEYIKLRDQFEALLARGPPLQIYNAVKAEADPRDIDSEDEPLALTSRKRHRKLDKRKKKETAKKKSNSKSTESWECSECGVRGSEGGVLAEAAHKLTSHDVLHANAPAAPAPAARVKLEPSRSQSPHAEYSNGLEVVLKVENVLFDEQGLGDDDDDDDYFPDNEFSKDTKPSKGRTNMLNDTKTNKSVRKKREAKTYYKCDQCNAKYTNPDRLQRHKENKHEESKPPYICEVCGAHYKHKRACDIHVAIHKGIGDWKCEECNKLFPSKNALLRHNNIHTGKLNYQCDLCGKSFIHTSSFKMHKLSHTGVKPHACDVCGLALMTRSHLKRHKRVHSGEKRHECRTCGKRFSERYNLLAHARSHDGGAAGAAGAGGAAGEGVEPRRRLFRCHYCVERFERRYMLERHTAAAHGRALERPPPTPRNTMSKLLKLQAARPAPPPEPHSPPDDKYSCTVSSAGSWPAEFPPRAHFPH